MTFGVWTGLLLGAGPLTLGLFFALFYLVPILPWALFSFLPLALAHRWR